MSLARVMVHTGANPFCRSFPTEIPCGEAEKLVWQSFRGSGPWGSPGLCNRNLGSFKDRSEAHLCSRALLEVPADLGKAGKGLLWLAPPLPLSF